MYLFMYLFAGCSNTMTSRGAFKYSRRGAASFWSLSDRELSPRPHCPQVHKTDDADIYTDAAGLR